MKQTIALVTLFVKDLNQSLAFYRALGFQEGFANDEVAFFQMNGLVFGLYRQKEFEAESGRAATFGGNAATLAHNAASVEEVDAIMQLAAKAGAEIIKPAAKTDWGGYSGYFADPDHHLWEVAHNPMWKVSAEGYVSLE